MNINTEELIWKRAYTEGYNTAIKTIYDKIQDLNDKRRNPAAILLAIKYFCEQVESENT